MSTPEWQLGPSELPLAVPRLGGRVVRFGQPEDDALRRGRIARREELRSLLIKFPGLGLVPGGLADSAADLQQSGPAEHRSGGLHQRERLFQQARRPTDVAELCHGLGAQALRPRRVVPVALGLKPDVRAAEILVGQVEFALTGGHSA